MVLIYLEGTEHFRYVCRGLVEAERSVRENQQTTDNSQSWNGKHQGGITVVNFVLAQQLHFQCPAAQTIFIQTKVEAKNIIVLKASI